ncbi:[Fe-Fe] hydrogenase large subunit C-terminal domain-containing protein [Aminipila sp.]|uniref:[Fe-Fe] hydrogenase large subunit C-terminal domain-containing protein n=1 Tax=Aminipila sp. TaxID=2060095 RepID=UPI00289A176E|nr:[Fe-Fe] hydrogenase large subunit C-terminal domain-containing protein [Aminipila sp.]
MNKFFHSVSLIEELCSGCINCIKRCPTQAIRVRHGKACITKEFCIDCGECVRTCQNHAKVINRDFIKCLNDFEYTVALPAPSLYSQFNNINNITDINAILTAILMLGFDDVYEVAAGAEVVTAATKDYVNDHKEQWPIVSTACPSVVRLIRVRFPNLIDHLLPLHPPVEIAAAAARKRAMEKTGLSSEKIGIIFISPCSSKVAYIKEPLGMEKSSIDRAIGITDIYPLILAHLQEASLSPLDLAIAGRVGIGWGRSSGEALALETDEYLSADGIENVVHVLEDLEDEKFGDLRFIELDACSGGCVGGVLTVENPFIAKTKLKKLKEALPKRHTEEHREMSYDDLYWKVDVVYEPVFQLGDNFIESVALMNQVNNIYEKFPKLDCGICGAPTCKALAEDIVKGNANENQCIHILKQQIHEISQDATTFANDSAINNTNTPDYIARLKKYINQIAMLDNDLNREE